MLQIKKYYEVGNSFIECTLRQHEWVTTATNRTPSASLPQRWKTDAAILVYLREKTIIPLPRLQHTLEGDGAFYFSTELVPGVSMAQLIEEQKQVVTEELLEHVATLKSLRSGIDFECFGVDDDVMLSQIVVIEDIVSLLNVGLWAPTSMMLPEPAVDSVGST